jgi:hypothetical protein
MMAGVLLYAVWQPMLSKLGGSLCCFCWLAAYAGTTFWLAMLYNLDMLAMIEAYLASMFS